MASKVWLEATLKNGFIKFIEYDSFEDITPIPIQGKNASSNKNLCWANWGNNQKNNKLHVALKTWKLNYDNIDHDAVERFVNELTLLPKVNFHANIIRFFGMSHVSSSDTYYLVTQYANGGTIRQHLQRNYHQLTWFDKTRIIKEIATGLQCIHNEGISHKNLHPNNVLVHDGRMMIADLGFSDTWHDSTTPYHDEMIPFLEPLNEMQLDSSFIKPGEVRFKLEPTPLKNIGNLSNKNGKRLIKRHSHPNILNISPSLPPTTSSRTIPPLPLDSIDLKDAANDIGDYVVIDKDELSGYTQPKPSLSDSDLTKKRYEKSRSLNFRYTRMSRTSYGDGNDVYMQREKNDEGKDVLFENISINNCQQPPILLIARYSPAKRIISAFEVLKNNGGNLRDKDIKLKTAIHKLIWNDDLFEMNIGFASAKYPRHNHFRIALKWLCSNNISINSRDEFGWTPLHEAIWKRREPGIISALLDHNANPNITDKHGSTSLHQCLNLLRTTTDDSEKSQLFGCIKLLLSNGANPNLSLPDHTLTLSGVPFPNSLFAAVYLDLPLDIIELMVKKGGDVASTSFRGLYLLDFAAKVNNIRALKYLTDHKNFFGKKSIFNALKYPVKSYTIKHEKPINRGRRFHNNISTV
ncbi:15751_t:CDS:2 [Funneliformis mosseae]|uniref:non-specific serine/threonine protein kinase n=1 Tax=Funneliformis mosseae TaxID=27381 RepID=A0A9N8W3J4_FUNMO|nr:15751_t:CDS:2 [Funneliformis mosseae]